MLTTLTNLTSTAATLASSTIVDLTKILNEGGIPNHVDTYMDAVKGIGHRIKHGHDLSELPTIFDKFGLDGAGKYFKHILGADLMSPHGIPVIPYTHEIGQVFGLTTKEIVDWMCVNVGDVLSGSLAVTNSYLNYKLLTTGTPNGKKLALILISSGIKLSASTANPNPITFLSSIFDIGLVAYAGTPLIMDHFFPRYSFGASAITSIKAGSFSFTGTALYLGAKEWYIKRNLKEIDYKMIARESSITGLSASVASMIYDYSRHFITQNEIASSAISIGSFMTTRTVLNQISNAFKTSRIKNSNFQIDIELIPVF